MLVYYFSCVQPLLSIISYIVYCIQRWLYYRDYDCTVLCLYKHYICSTKALQYFSVLSLLVLELLSLKALDPIMSSTTNTNHKNALSTTVSVRLNIDNYLLWKSLVLPLIRGCKLDGYILGIKECPEPFVTTSEKTQKNQSWLWRVDCRRSSSPRVAKKFNGHWYCNTVAAL